jgi:hypothetical protein
MSRVGATLTCGKCSRSEFFEGDLLPALDASRETDRWFTDKRGFLVCGDCRDKLNAEDDFAKSIDVAYAAVRERVANGGSSWTPKREGD